MKLFGKKMKKEMKADANEWKKLPEALQAPYAHFSKWKKEGEAYHLDVSPGSPEWNHMEQMLHKMDGKNIKPSRVEAVFNPTLTGLFVVRREVMNVRAKKNPQIFMKKDWVKKARADEREVVHKHFLELVESLGVNEPGNHIPIICAAHGTGSATATAIAQTGFANLSILDEGWYGSGIYFTTNVLYTTPYLQKDQPAIILSYLIPGNAYPVVENRKASDSLCGKPLHKGTSSHYVLTDMMGETWQGKGPAYNEIVIHKETQVMPVYIIHLDHDSLPAMASEFEREVPKPSVKEHKDGNEDDDEDDEGDDHDDALEVADV